MQELKEILKNNEIPSLKMKVNNRFKDSVKNNSLEKSGQSENIKTESYPVLIKKAHNLLANYLESTDKNYLEQSTECLVKAVEIGKFKADAYFYLAYIFFICSENKKAESYLNIVKYINPEYTGIQELENDINEDNYQKYKLNKTQSQEEEAKGINEPKIRKVQRINI